MQPVCLTVSIRVHPAEKPPPAGAPAGVDHGPQELPTAELDCLHLRPHLLHLHHCQQQQRQNHQKVHAGGGVGGAWWDGGVEGADGLAQGSDSGGLSAAFPTLVWRLRLSEAAEENRKQAAAALAPPRILYHQPFCSFTLGISPPPLSNWPLESVPI